MPVGSGVMHAGNHPDSPLHNHCIPSTVGSAVQYNVWFVDTAWEERCDALVDILGEILPDVFCFQVGNVGEVGMVGMVRTRPNAPCGLNSEFIPPPLPPPPSFCSFNAYRK